MKPKSAAPSDNRFDALVADVRIIYYNNVASNERARHTRCRFPVISRLSIFFPGFEKRNSRFPALSAVP
jgi:hypothetical protein